MVSKAPTGLACANGCESDGTPQRCHSPALICDRCQLRLREWLQAIPLTYAMLPSFLAPGSVSAGPDDKGGRHKVSHSPAGARLEVVDLLDVRNGESASALVGKWARRLRQERGLSPQANPTVVTECALLLAHISWLAAQSWVTECYADMGDLHRALRDAVGDYRQKPVGECTVLTDDGAECGGPLMPQPYGGVVCTRCRARWGFDELRRLGLLLESDEQEAS